VMMLLIVNALFRKISEYKISSDKLELGAAEMNKMIKRHTEISQTYKITLQQQIQFVCDAMPSVHQ
jgi:hypothetical protein